MPPTSSEQSQPQYQGPFTTPLTGAIEAHQVFVHQLERWQKWMANQTREDSRKLTLYLLIRDIIERRKPGGDLESVDEDIIPKPLDLYDLLDFAISPRAGPKRFSDYQNRVESLRQPVEESVCYLIKTYLEPLPARAYLASLPYAERLEFANKIADGLADTYNGLLYLGKCLFMEPEPGSPLPLFHPDSLFNVPGGFTANDFGWMRRAGKVYVDCYLKLVKALIKNPDAGRLYITLTARLFSKYFPDLDVHPDLGQEEFKALLVRVQQLYGRDADRLGKLAGAKVPALIGIVIELANVFLVFKDVRDPSSWDGARFGRSLASLASAVSSAQEHISSIPSWLKFSHGFNVGFSALTGFVDVIFAAQGAATAWYEKDYSVAGGHILQGVGLGGAAAVSAWGALLALAGGGGSGAAASLAHPLLAVAFAVVALAGAVVIATTAEGKVELWFEHNYFGKEWDDVDVDERPESPYFLWKTRDGRPRYARQVSDLLSILQPVELSVDKFSYDARDGQGNTEPGQGIHIDLPKGSDFQDCKFFIKRIIYSPTRRPDGSWVPEWRLAPLMELRLDSFEPRPDGSRRCRLEWADLARHVPAGEDISDWWLEIDVVHRDQVALDWEYYKNIPKDDLDYLVPYLYVRRIRLK